MSRVCAALAVVLGAAAITVALYSGPNSLILGLLFFSGVAAAESI